MLGSIGHTVNVWHLTRLCAQLMERSMLSTLPLSAPDADISSNKHPRIHGGSSTVTVWIQPFHTLDKSQPHLDQKLPHRGPPPLPHAGYIPATLWNQPCQIWIKTHHTLHPALPNPVSEFDAKVTVTVISQRPKNLKKCK